MKTELARMVGNDGRLWRLALLVDLRSVILERADGTTQETDAINGAVFKHTVHAWCTIGQIHGRLEDIGIEMPTMDGRPVIVDKAKVSAELSAELKLRGLVNPVAPTDRRINALSLADRIRDRGNSRALGSVAAGKIEEAFFLLQDVQNLLLRIPSDALGGITMGEHVPVFLRSMVAPLLDRICRYAFADEPSPSPASRIETSGGTGGSVPTVPAKSLFTVGKYGPMKVRAGDMHDRVMGRAVAVERSPMGRPEAERFARAAARRYVERETHAGRGEKIPRYLHRDSHGFYVTFGDHPIETRFQPHEWVIDAIVEASQ